MSGENYMASAGAPQIADSVSREEARRRAFEINLTEQLEARLPADVAPSDVARLASVLGEAHAGTHHEIEARTSFWLGKRYYFVLQAGAALLNDGVDDAHPFAARILARLSVDDRAYVDRWIEPVTEALTAAELPNSHALDWRMARRVRGFGAYLTLIGGRDRRENRNPVSMDRRAPTDEGLGLLVLSLIVALVCALGVCLIAMTIWSAWTLLVDAEGRAALSAAFHRAMERSFGG